MTQEHDILDRDEQAPQPHEPGRCFCDLCVPDWNHLDEEQKASEIPTVWTVPVIIR